tara:strand:- start:60624 stop:60902 length:279 start_codon:yes stop_codon:yes gene_type:complete
VADLWQINGKGLAAKRNSDERHRQRLPTRLTILGRAEVQTDMGRQRAHGANNSGCFSGSFRLEGYIVSKFGNSRGSTFDIDAEIRTIAAPDP